MSLDDSDRDERTIFVGNLSEKITQELLSELFLQAGPLERVSIPKDKDGKNKTFGFVTYKHLVAIPYALNIFSSTCLFGKELLLKNRNTGSNSNNRNSFSNPSTPSASSLTSSLALNPLLNAISDPCMVPNMNFMPAMGFDPQQQQQLFNQQFMQMDFAMQMYNQINSESAFPSTRSDQVGSQRERDLVDRHRYHRGDDDRNNRNKPYNRRSRSRSPYRNRSRSPNNRRGGGDRDRRRGDDRGYHRWNYRK